MYITLQFKEFYICKCIDYSMMDLRKCIIYVICTGCFVYKIDYVQLLCLCMFFMHITLGLHISIMYNMMALRFIDV